MKDEEIVKLLKSGNFTIVYHDNCSPSLYKPLCVNESETLTP